MARSGVSSAPLPGAKWPVLTGSKVLRRRILSIATLACLGPVGCGGDRVSSSNPSPDEARGALREVLTAWKEGKTEELNRREPPLRFYDLDRDQGVKLLDFEIKDASVHPGQAVEIPVKLTLQDRRGTRRTQNAVYQVTAQPDIVVLRSDP